MQNFKQNIDYKSYSFLEKIVVVACFAGQEIMKVYNTSFEVKYKKDTSPLTKADLIANKVICEELTKLLDIPILSEENAIINYKERKNWEYFWLVDPLDGTKEFISKNGEFTVNIALIEKGEPVLGVIYAPALDTFYFASKFLGCFKKIKKNIKNDTLVIVGSRSHDSEEFDFFVEKKRLLYKEIKIKKVGSSLKFCLIADGLADVYPRLGQTKEWDTAAGHIIAKMAGRKVVDFNSEKELVYNKKILINPNFIVY
ncbi:MAG: 3'(2'),5'-bisphosphate nucleotidase CysQ [Candidatus Margulisiibacteriota bacterium]|jgi:3'(2'), 5'-bisphosphate nucleotidase